MLQSYAIQPDRVALLVTPSCTDMGGHCGSAGAAAEAWKTHIDRLAAEHGAPSFQPHVTLVGNTYHSHEAALQRAHQLAQSLKVP